MSTPAKPNGKLVVPPVIGRTVSGGFKTEDGTIYVSKPYRSKKSKKLRAMVAFMPRKSAFDTTNEMSGTNEFRGFFTLFWISIFLFTVRTYILSLEENGYFLPFAFARKFSQDAITLALSDAALVLTTGLCVPFVMAIRNGWIRFYWLGVVIQHTFQAAVLGIVVRWTFNRQWPWVQSGFLTLHALVLIMKMHSYMSINGYLSHVAQQASSAQVQLRTLVDSKVGGWDNAIAVAEARRADADMQSGASSETESSAHLSVPNISVQAASTPATPMVEATVNPLDDRTTKTVISANNAAQLRQRLARAAGEPISPVAAASGPNGAKTALTPPSPTSAPETSSDMDSDKPHAPGVHPLVDHPDEAISNLATELSELESELVSSGPEYVKWPNNISWKNFAVYMLIPTLCYELEYPRTDRIRPLYVFEKTVATFGSFALLYTVTESFILPLTPTPDQSFFRSLLDLALPFMVAYLLLFYLIFECICNGFAELSYFADRQFYEDWWNSTSWDEFSRKWNKPVHAFLLRHVYASTISTYHLSRSSAMFVTFLLSACVHELVMAIVTQKIRLYLFALQLVQIPLIMVGRLPVIRRNKLAGNIVFWLGLYAGFPLLCVAYCAY